MPGYLFSSSKSNKDPIYAPLKNNNKSKGAHPLFRDLKKQEFLEREEYVQYLKTKNARVAPSKFNSLHLLGSQNDTEYLDAFMSMPRQNRRMSICDENDLMRSQTLAKSASTVFGSKSSKAKVANVPQTKSSVSLAMLNSLKSSNSEDSLYESIEKIHYLKTKKNLDRQLKTKTIQKTGHSLFDHLREEQAMKAPSIKSPARRKMSVPDRTLNRNDYNYFSQTSNGSSPTHSTSSSGDEYETFSKGSSSITTTTNSRKMMNKSHNSSPCFHHQGSESDEDWAIPRPLFMKQMINESKSGARRKSTVFFTTASDDSDSSIKSNEFR